MFHTGRDCAACQPLLFSTAKIESSLAKFAEATSQGNPTCVGFGQLAVIEKDNQDDSQDD